MIKPVPAATAFRGVNRLAFRSEGVRRNNFGFGSESDATIAAANSDYLLPLLSSDPSRDPFKVVLEGKRHTETCDIDPATLDKLR